MNLNGKIDRYYTLPYRPTQLPLVGNRLYHILYISSVLVIIDPSGTEAKRKENLHLVYFAKIVTGKSRSDLLLIIEKKINTGLSKEKCQSYSIVKEGVNIIILKENIQHTGEYKSSRLQQVMQRSRSGAYVKTLVIYPYLPYAQ